MMEAPEMKPALLNWISMNLPCERRKYMKEAMK